MLGAALMILPRGQRFAAGTSLAGMFDSAPEQWSTCPDWRHSSNLVNDDNNPEYGLPIDNSDGSDYSVMDSAAMYGTDPMALNPYGRHVLGVSNVNGY